MMILLELHVALNCNGEPPALYYPISEQMDALRLGPDPVAKIGQLARDTEERHSIDNPDAMPFVFGAAAHLIGYSLGTNTAGFSTYNEMLFRQRRYLSFVSLKDRFRFLSDRGLPLSSEIEAVPARGKDSVKRSELEILLSTWKELSDELGRVRDWPFEQVYANTLREFFPRDAAGEIAYQEEKARNKAAAERMNYVHMLRVDGARFTNQVIDRVARHYSTTPALLNGLQETMDGYLPPADSTNVMNKVFAAMKPEVAAKTPRPVPGAKGERWLRPAAAPTGPVTPAVARPNRVVDAMRKQQAEQAAGAANTVSAESPAGMVVAAGGTPVWAWLGLGLVALAGGWVWLRSRS